MRQQLANLLHNYNSILLNAEMYFSKFLIVQLLTLIAQRHSRCIV